MSQLQVLLIRRGIEPFQGSWALPGGFVGVDEPLDDAARRELQEETGVKNVYIEQFHTFGSLGRDPRERVVSVAYMALVNSTQSVLRASTDADAVAWFPLKSLPQLAFDHSQIIELGLERLQTQAIRFPIGFELLPPKFTLTQLQRLYEAIRGHELDKRNFRKKIHNFDLLKPHDEYLSTGRMRPAQLFSFDRKRYMQLRKTGFLFEV